MMGWNSPTTWTRIPGEGGSVLYNFLKNLPVSCPFCDYEGQILSQDQDFMVIRDLAPRAPYHYLVIPKDHVPDFSDLDLLRRAVGMAMSYQLPDKKLVINFGSFLQVPHAHLHLMSQTPLVPIV